MDTAVPVNNGGTIPHPLDVVEKVFYQNEWPFHRKGDNLTARYEGGPHKYQIHFEWDYKLSALYFTCSLDFEVAEPRQQILFELIGLANDRIWLGSFILNERGDGINFRYTLLLHGTQGPSSEQLEAMVDVALDECIRFYPAFSFSILGGMSPIEAIQNACVTPLGEA